MSQLNYIKQTTIYFLLFFTLGFVIIQKGITEENTTALSGHIINLKGEPIPDTTIILLYLKMDEFKGIYPIYDVNLYPFLHGGHALYNKGKFPDFTDKYALPPYLMTKTDAEGKFSFSNISSNLIQLMVIPIEELQKDPPQDEHSRRQITLLPKIHTLHIGDITFIPNQDLIFPPNGAVTFTIKPGTHIEDVTLKVSMEDPLNIRGRIIFENGEPLTNTSLGINIGQVNDIITNYYPFYISVSIQTDEDGYFEQNVLQAGIYACSVKHRGLSAISEPFLLDGNTPHDGIVLTLNGNTDELTELQENKENEQDTISDILHDIKSVWILNPDNGHVYKRIGCKSRKDAELQASREDAHLVTITSKNEQLWLEAVFGTSSYWIGLSGDKKEHIWEWDTGERIRYSNWIKDEFHRPPPAIFRLFVNKDKILQEKKDLDYAIMTLDVMGNMKWGGVYNWSSDGGFAYLAVIEKNSK